MVNSGTKLFLFLRDLNALERPLPLPKPKPDTTFAYSKAAFDQSQLATMDLLVQSPNGSSFASPYQDLRFPFAVIEYKSQANDGSIRVATNKAAGTGAVALNGILELMSRGPVLNASDLNKPLFFSVTMDQNSAYINVNWINKTPDTDQHTFHLEELRLLPLKYGDSIQVLQRALKNIHDYATDELLKLIRDALDEYRNKRIKKRSKASEEKPQAMARLHTPPSPQPPSRTKKLRAAIDAREEIVGGSEQAKQGTLLRVESQRPKIRTGQMTKLAEPE